jgi:hypothetical protein
MAPQMSPSFRSFAGHVNLKPDSLEVWEQDLRQQLVDILLFLQGPLPLADWIDHRIGGELETFQDQNGGLMVGFRGQGMAMGFAPAPGFGQKGGSKGGNALPLDPQRAAKDAALHAQRSATFFSKLPADSFTVNEVRLREAIFDFLARKKNIEGVRCSDLDKDRKCAEFLRQFCPKVITLKEWTERRMGAELLFKGPFDHVKMTPVAKEFLQERKTLMEQGGGAQANEGNGGGKRKADAMSSQQDSQMNPRQRLNSIVASLTAPAPRQVAM